MAKTPKASPRALCLPLAQRGSLSLGVLSTGKPRHGTCQRQWIAGSCSPGLWTPLGTTWGGHATTLWSQG